MCTVEEFAQPIRTVLDLRRNTPLSQAAAEVLAVIAYNQPVTKAFVEQVRGVDCSGVISGLISRQLIEEKGRLELPGKPLVYGTTEHFLRCFFVYAFSVVDIREDLTAVRHAGIIISGRIALHESSSDAGTHIAVLHTEFPHDLSTLLEIAFSQNFDQPVDKKKEKGC